jgi:16S rRNA (cytosine967-C5)-methyltransferase
MSERNPFRNRKSVAKHGRGKNKRKTHEPKHPNADLPVQPLPPPQNARELAVAVIEEYKRTKTFVSEIFETFDLTLSDPDRRLAVEMATGIVRREVTLDRILTAFVARPKQQVEPRLWTFLQLGAYQLLLMDRIPSHAAVSETVDLTKWIRESAWTGFLNGVLRSIARDLETEDDPETQSTDANQESQSQRSKRTIALQNGKFRTLKRDIFSDPETQTVRYISESYGFPLWLVKRWSKRFSTDDLFTMCDWYNSYGKLFLRVNQIQASRDEVLNLFAGSEDIAEGQYGPGDLPECIWYDGPLKPIDLPGFVAGLITVQDETAMSVSRLLAPEPGWKVLDMCAAPGTKSTHLAELMNGEGVVVAADSSARRLQQVGQNIERLGLSCIQIFELKEDSSNLGTDEFDAALVDVPCSNTGVLGKRPEVRSRLQMGEFAELSVLQLRILQAAAKAVKVTGRLVYSTCSIEPEENSGVVSTFLQSNDWELISQTEHIPGQPTDGGFQALFRKLS